MVARTGGTGRRRAGRDAPRRERQPAVPELPINHLALRFAPVLRGALVVGVVLVLAGCGGSAKPKPPAAPPDPGRAVAAELVRASATGNTRAIWDVLSNGSQKRSGSFAAFDAKVAPSIVRAFRPFADGSYRVLVSELLTERLGVVALARGSYAYAFPLARESGGLRLVLPRRMTIDVLGPQPGSKGPVAQVGVEIHGSGVGDAVLYVDGQTVEPHVATAARSATVFGNLPNALPAGRHTAVVFVALGANAAARAWTFTAS
jgi:hypothetical protein